MSTLGERENGEARYTLSLATPCCLHVGRAGERGGALYTLSRHSLLSPRWESGRTGKRVIHSLSTLPAVYPVVSAGELGGALYTLSRHSLLSPHWESGRTGRHVIHSMSPRLAVSTLGERESREARYTLSLATPCCLHVGRAGERKARYTLSLNTPCCLHVGRAGERGVAL